MNYTDLINQTKQKINNSEEEIKSMESQLVVLHSEIKKKKEEFRLLKKGYDKTINGIKELNDLYNAKNNSH